MSPQTLPPKNPGEICFTAEIKDAGGGGAFVEFPFDVEELFGTRGRVPVRLTVNGTEYRGSLMPYSGRRLIGLPKAFRTEAGVAMGDQVEVLLEVDSEERVIEAPPDLLAALAADDEASAGWRHLSCTHQREWVEAILGAKRPETRAKRIVQAIDAGRKRARQGPVQR